MFQSYSNNLSLQNKRTEIVASFNLGQNFALEIATKYTGLFCLPLQRKTPIVTNYLFASSILRNTQLTMQLFDEYFFSCETLFRKPRILHLHLSHNAPYFPPPPPPPKKLPNRVCFFFFTFLLGITAVPREIENNAYAKFWRANKVHYGRCARGVDQ